MGGESRGPNDRLVGMTLLDARSMPWNLRFFRASFVDLSRCRSNKVQLDRLRAPKSSHTVANGADDTHNTWHEGQG